MRNALIIWLLSGVLAVAATVGSPDATLSSIPASAITSGTMPATAVPAFTGGDVTNVAGSVVLGIVAGKHYSFHSATTGNVNIPASTTIFLPLDNTSTNALLWTSDVSGGTRSLVPARTTLRNMYVVSSVNPGTAKATITLMTNGVASSLACGPSGGTTTNDLIHTETVIAGTEAGWKIVIASGATTAKYTIAVETDQ